jgi:hypothetical protein
MAETPASDIDFDNTWVTISEATEMTGYNRSYVQRLARNNWNLPEDQRLIRVRKPDMGYLVWLPDLINYMVEHGNGPHLKNQNSTTT